MVKLDNVQKHYGDFNLNCSIQLEEGHITGIIGANGAGKSTMFKSILGLISTDGGTVEILGKGGSKLDTSDKQQIGVVFADSTFNGSFSIMDITTIMESMYENFDKKTYLEKCEKYGLPLKKRIHDFSTGMTAKFKLLTAMSYGAKLLILDEPTVGLDSVVRSDLLDEMREFMEQEGRAILISSHISSDLEGLCDDLYFLKDGNILFHEDTDVILSDYAILKVSEEQYINLDKSRVLYRKKEPFGYMLLTGNKQYYLDNYREIVAERGSIDDVLLMMAKGERIQ
ncbi:MAG: ABC transporter ATP-binding protein [Lachnospiraceae bacterium]|nr:ABC transporter ATP-binding protein [Lachnospiraceae bacterium]